MAVNIITDWDSRFMDLALVARSWVKGPDVGVGACDVSPDRRGISLGYSGLPKGMSDFESRLGRTEFKDKHLVHAELNAILNAGRSVQGWTLYTTTFPCSHCAAAMIQAGIARVGVPDVYLTSESRWYQSWQAAKMSLMECDVEILEISMGLEEVR